MAKERIITPVQVTPEAFSKYGKLFPIKYTEKEPVEDSENLTAWLDVMGFDGGSARTVIMLTVKRRPMVLTQMERHVKTIEWWTMINGRCVAAFAEGKNPNNPDEGPDMDKVVAFYMDGVAAYITNAGTWHWPAFPVTDTATQLVDVKVGTVENDIDIKPLAASVRIVV
jgi:ureidoglycolate hydrolase